MKPEKLHKPGAKARKDAFEENPFHSPEKVKLGRRQYLTNLLATNQNCLRNNNINTLLLF